MRCKKTQPNSPPPNAPQTASMCARYYSCCFCVSIGLTRLKVKIYKTAIYDKSVLVVTIYLIFNCPTRLQLLKKHIVGPTALFLRLPKHSYVAGMGQLPIGISAGEDLAKKTPSKLKVHIAYQFHKVT